MLPIDVMRDGRTGEDSMSPGTEQHSCHLLQKPIKLSGSLLWRDRGI